MVPPPLDPLMRATKLLQVPNNRKVVYNHRLYATYGTGDFLQFVQNLENIELVVTDPMANRSDKRNALSSSPTAYRQMIRSLPQAKLFDGAKSRTYYKSLIIGGRIGVAAFRRACVWSMSAIDCIGLDVPVIAPRYAAYPEFIPDHMLFDTERQAIDLAHRLLNDDEFWEMSLRETRSIIPELMSQQIAAQIMGIFNRCMSRI